MQDEIQRQILGAVLLVLRPLARALLKVGVGYREFSEIAKTAFVQTASQDYGLRGRPTNISRVAVMTGLTRKEVSRIRNKTGSPEETVVMKTTPVSQVLHRWHTDREFLDMSGLPERLQFEGDESSFSSLVKKYAGDVPPGAMRTELLRIDALEIDDSGLMSPTKRAAYNVELHDRLVGGLAGILYPASLNLAHNIVSGSTDSKWANFAATSRYVSSHDKGRVLRMSTDRIKEFIENMDDMFGAYESLYEDDPSSHSESAIGVGVFYFEEEKSESDVFF